MSRHLPSHTTFVLAALLVTTLTYGNPPPPPHNLSPLEIFSRIDQNRDGHISKSEFMSDPKSQNNPDMARQVFQQVDSNQDNKLSFEEFSQLP